MDPTRTAVILIGFQNDYFSPDGILYNVIEDPGHLDAMLGNTVNFLHQLVDSPALIVSTPIVFTPDYSELVDPVGILKIIKEVGAFQAGTRGAATIDALRPFSDRIIEVPGKRGLNAFSNTELDTLFHEHKIKDVVIAGVVTSLCVDSTARSAAERGYAVTVLSDCTAGRTTLEQEFYCTRVLPFYTQVINHAVLLRWLGLW